MKHKATADLRALTVALFVIIHCGSFAQAVVTADFGTAPTGTSQPFTVNLVLSNTTANISGFTFRVFYDSSQITFSSATDNTGQPGAGVDYTIGPVTAGTAGGNSNTFRAISMTTNLDLLNPVTNLAQLNFTTTAGYTGPIPGNCFLTDNGPSDGLFNDAFQDIPHTFSSFPSGIPDWELY